MAPKRHQSGGWGGSTGLEKTTRTPQSTCKCGGGGGIRTHERLAPLPVFKTGAFNQLDHPSGAARRSAREGPPGVARG